MEATGQLQAKPRAVRPRGGGPATPGARKLNLACGKDIRPRAEGWTNMDVVALPGVDVAHDALDVPWPYPDNSFDHVLASHYLEHVPHRLENGNHKDGLIQVLEEVHRVLRPGGTLEVFGPHPDGTLVWVDPTHTRVVHPRNFEYFAAATGFDYYSTARFEVILQEVSGWGGRAPGFLRLGKSRLGLFEHLTIRTPALVRWMAIPQELHMVLRAVKAPREGGA